MEKSKLYFTNPIIKNINYKVNLNLEPYNDGSIDIANTFKLNIKRAENKNEALVELNIIIGEEDEKLPFFIDMIICAIFKWEDAYDEKTLQGLLSINAPALLLGYARPMIATITNMSPYPVYNLPFYNFTK